MIELQCRHKGKPELPLRTAITATSTALRGAVAAIICISQQSLVILQ